MTVADNSIHEDRFGRLETKLDSIGTQLGGLSEKIAVLSDRYEKIGILEGRVAALENWRAWILGAAAVLAGILNAHA